MDHRRRLRRRPLKLLTVTEAAARLGRSPGFVRGLIADHRVACVEHRGRRYIPETELLHLAVTVTGRHEAQATVHQVRRRRVA